MMILTANHSNWVELLIDQKVGESLKFNSDFSFILNFNRKKYKIVFRKRRMVLLLTHCDCQHKGPQNVKLQILNRSQQ